MQMFVTTSTRIGIRLRTLDLFNVAAWNGMHITEHHDVLWGGGGGGREEILLDSSPVHVCILFEFHANLTLDLNDIEYIRALHEISKLLRTYSSTGSTGADCMPTLHATHEL